jgi:hypothetical protein
MGRSFLSVKLAFGFGIFVAVLVLVAGQVTVDAVSPAPAAAEQPVQFRGLHAADGGDEVEVCLWRGCPSMVHPRIAPRSVAETKAARATREG